MRLSEWLSDSEEDDAWLSLWPGDIPEVGEGCLRLLSCQESVGDFFSFSEVEDMLYSLSVAVTCAVCERFVGKDEELWEVAVVQSCGHYFCSRCINTIMEKGFEETCGMKRARLALGLVKGEVDVKVGAENGGEGKNLDDDKEVPSKLVEEKSKRGKQQRPKRRCFQCPICLGPAMKWTLTSPVPLLSNLVRAIRDEVPELGALLEAGNTRDEGEGSSRRSRKGKEKVVDAEVSEFDMTKRGSASITVLSSQGDEEGETVSPPKLFCRTPSVNTVKEESPQNYSTIVSTPLLSTEPTPLLSSPVAKLSTPTTKGTSLLGSRFHVRQLSTAVPHHPSSLDCSMNLFELVSGTECPLLSSPPPLPGSPATLSSVTVSCPYCFPSETSPASPSWSFPDSRGEGRFVSEEEATSATSLYHLQKGLQHRSKRHRSISSVRSSQPGDRITHSTSFAEGNPSREEEDLCSSAKDLHSGRRVLIVLDQSMTGQKILLELKTYFHDFLGNFKCEKRTNIKVEQSNCYPLPACTSSLILIDERNGAESSSHMYSQQVRNPILYDGGACIPHGSGLHRSFDGFLAQQSFVFDRFIFKHFFRHSKGKQNDCYLVCGNWEALRLSKEQWSSLIFHGQDTPSLGHSRLQHSHGKSYLCWCIPVLTPMVCTPLVHPQNDEQEGNEEEFKSWWSDLCVRLREISGSPSPVFSFPSFFPPFPFVPLQRNWTIAHAPQIFANKGMEHLDEEETIRTVFPLAWKRNGKVSGIQTPHLNAFASLLRFHLNRVSSSLSFPPLADTGMCTPTQPSSSSATRFSGAWIEAGGYAFFFLPDTWCRKATILLSWWWWKGKQQEMKKGERGGEEVYLPPQDQFHEIACFSQCPSSRCDACDNGQPCEQRCRLPIVKDLSLSSDRIKKSRRSCFQFLRSLKDDLKIRESVTPGRSDSNAGGIHISKSEPSEEVDYSTAGFSHSSWQRLVQAARGAVIEASYRTWVELLVYHLTTDIPILSTLVDPPSGPRAAFGKGAAMEDENRIFLQAAFRLEEELGDLHDETDSVPSQPSFPSRSYLYKVASVAERRPAESSRAEEGTRRAGLDDDEDATDGEEGKQSKLASSPFMIQLHHFAPRGTGRKFSTSSPFLSSLETGVDGEEDCSAPRVEHFFLLHQTLTDSFLEDCQLMAKSRLEGIGAASFCVDGQVGLPLQDVHDGNHLNSISTTSRAYEWPVTSEHGAPGREHEKVVCETDSTSTSLLPTSILRALFSHLLTDIAKSLFLLVLLQFSTSSISSILPAGKKGGAINPTSFFTEELAARAEARTAGWFLTNLAEGRKEAGVKRAANSRGLTNRSIYRSPFSPSLSTPMSSTPPPSQEEPLARVSGESKEFASSLRLPPLKVPQGDTAVLDQISEKAESRMKKKHPYISLDVSVEKEVETRGTSASSVMSEKNFTSETQSSADLYPVFRNLLYEDSL